MKKLIAVAAILFVTLSAQGQVQKMKTSENKQLRQHNVIRENNLATVRSFFELMHRKEIEQWSRLWDDNAFIYIPYPVKDFPDTIAGRETIAGGFRALFAGFKSFDYSITAVYPAVDPEVVVTEYTVSAVLLKTNALYHGRNIAVFKFRNGRIMAYHDYFNPEKFKMVIETMAHQTKKENVEFSADGLRLSGHLYLPAGFDASKQYPAVVTGGSLTSVKEQMAGTYAARLAAKGFIALAFDYRSYGESAGQPRQYEDPQLKLRDLRSAVTYLLSLPYVQAVGALGVCTSGGNVAYLAAEDSRIKAAVAVASHMADASVLPALYGSNERIDSLRKASTDAKALFDHTGANTIIPAYSNKGNTASHVGPMEYYMDMTRGGGVKEWKNEFSVMSWAPWLAFDPVSKAADISVPVMMFHSDGCALPGNAKKFYDALKGKKEMVWSNAYHFDYYDNPATIDTTIEKMSRFLMDHVK